MVLPCDLGPQCYRASHTWPESATSIHLTWPRLAGRRQFWRQLEPRAFVLQRRGYAFTQLFPDNPSAPPFTWHADSDGRIVLERVHPSEGKDAWLFSRHTVANLEVGHGIGPLVGSLKTGQRPGQGRPRPLLTLQTEGHVDREDLSPAGLAGHAAAPVGQLDEAVAQDALRDGRHGVLS